MKKNVNIKKSLGIVVGLLFAFALFLNTSINYNNDKNEAIFSLISLQTAQAQEEQGVCYETVCYLTIDCFTLPDGTEECYQDEVCFEIEVAC